MAASISRCGRAALRRSERGIEGAGSFFGADSYYMNHDANHAYAMSAPNEGRLSMPVMFLHGRFDFTCETVESRMADPMRELCSDLTEHVVDSGH